MHRLRVPCFLFLLSAENGQQNTVAERKTPPGQAKSSADRAAICTDRVKSGDDRQRSASTGRKLALLGQESKAGNPKTAYGRSKAPKTLAYESIILYPPPFGKCRKYKRRYLKNPPIISPHSLGENLKKSPQKPAKKPPQRVAFRPCAAAEILEF